MIYRITREDNKDNQCYFIKALNSLSAITILYKKFPEYIKENLELTEWDLEN
jgi:hypothetical protein